MKGLFLKTMSLLAMVTLACGIARADVPLLPDPAVDTETATAFSPNQTIVLAGGCFWGVQAVFQHLKGVTKAVSGYAGGSADTAKYEQVSMGNTGHAESVQVTYDPSQITLGKILKVYFSVAPDPTQLNRQGPDTGTQYRSEIFFTTPEQEKIATAYIAQLERAKVFSSPIVTTMGKLQEFYPAEEYHQNYATLHPDRPYIVINDLPKLANLKNSFPELYTEKP